MTMDEVESIRQNLLAAEIEAAAHLVALVRDSLAWYQASNGEEAPVLARLWREAFEALPAKLAEEYGAKVPEVAVWISTCVETHNEWAPYTQCGSMIANYA